LEPWNFMTFPSSWETNHPNWLIFFRGVGIPLTSYNWIFEHVFSRFPYGGNPWVSTITLSQVLTALDEAISITKEDQAERFLKAWFQRKTMDVLHLKMENSWDIDMFWEQDIGIWGLG